MIGALATTLCFAVTAVFANRAAHRVGSASANFLRLLIAAIVLGIWSHTMGTGPGGASLPWFLASGVAGFGIGGFAMFQSLPRLGSSLSMLIVQCGSAVFAATLEWTWLGTNLALVQVGCIAITLVGISVGMLPRSLPPVAPMERTAGIAWAMLSALGQGAGAVMSRNAFATAMHVGESVDAGTAAYERALAGLLVAAIALAIVFSVRRERPREKGRAWPWVVANAVTGPILGVAFFQWALSTTPAGVVQAIAATAPLLTIPIAGWFEGRWPLPRYYTGVLVAVAGVAGLFALR